MGVKKKLSWMVFWQAGTPSNNLLAAVGTQSSQVRTLITEQEVRDFGQDVTLLRVIGEYGFFVENAAAAVNRPYFHAAAMLVRESSDQSLGSVDLSSAAQIEEYPLSWIRTWSGLPDGVSSQGQQGLLDAVTPGTALEKMDVRVKRKLRTGDQLVFQTASKLVAFGANALPANADLTLHDWLRVRILVETS